MAMQSIGDMSQAFLNRNHNARLRSDLNRLTNELSIGETTDPGRRLKGDLGQLSNIEGRVSDLSAYRIAGIEMGGALGRMQVSLDAIRRDVEQLSVEALTGTSSLSRDQIENLSSGAEQGFRTTVSRLNVRSGDRSLFSGAATNRNALASADVLLDALRAAVAGATDTAGLKAAVDDFFDAPGGAFETIGYTGSALSMTPRSIAEGETVSADMKADAPSIRSTLKGLAMVIFAAEAPFTDDVDEARALVSAGGEVLIRAGSDLTAAQAGIGRTEARVEGIRVANEAEATSLGIARNNLLGIDPYETASRLQEVQIQLETHYTVTARLSRLSLANYL